MNGDANLAVFCDFENIAIGARDAKYARFDIQKVLQKLLLKGSIVVKKAYCDWDRYKEFKSGMHEAAFELIEIPHVRQSGKNSADIRMVVDALDLCYTKAHLDTFVIISGDSDFSPLVSKLRENAKTVIGVGVKSSTSDLLMSTCDEFILYDDLVRSAPAPRARRRRPAAKPPEAAAQASSARAGDRARPDERSPEDRAPEERTLEERAPEQRAAENKAADARETRRQEAIDLVLQTIDELRAERGDIDKLWGSLVKQTLKRRKPTFNESYYGFRSFNDLLEEAKARGQLDIERDGKSGGYVIRAVPREGQPEAPVAPVAPVASVAPVAPVASADRARSRRRPAPLAPRRPRDPDDDIPF